MRLIALLLCCLLLTSCAREVPAAGAVPEALPTPGPTPDPTPVPAPTPPPMPDSPAPRPSPESGRLLLDVPEGMEPLSLDERRDDGVATLRSQGGESLPFDPAKLVRAWGCRDGGTVQVEADEVTEAFAGAELPVTLIPHPDYPNGVDVTYRAIESLPIGGKHYEAAVFLLDQESYGPHGSLLLFLKGREGWMLYDAIDVQGMDGFMLNRTDYTPTYGYEPHVLKLHDSVILLYGYYADNAWLVLRGCVHGTGFNQVNELWYNLYTGEFEVSAILSLLDVHGRDDAGIGTYAYGAVNSYDLSMVEVMEEVSYTEGDLYAEGVRDSRMGVWRRRYALNEASYSMELEEECYHEGMSLARLFSGHYCQGISD